MQTVAALFVETGGIYYQRAGVEPWDKNADARRYGGPFPVVAHPPCERWGRYARGGPNPHARRREIGDDAGCFQAAFGAVRRFGGVIEHPEASHAWRHYGIPAPPRAGGWVFIGHAEPDWGRRLTEWTCCVEQGHYGHRARKATWLYCVGVDTPPDLIWGPSAGERLDEGFHSREERAAARAAGRAPIKRPSAKENAATPPAFADLLISLARGAR